MQRGSRSICLSGGEALGVVLLEELLSTRFSASLGTVGLAAPAERDGNHLCASGGSLEHLSGSSSFSPRDKPPKQPSARATGPELASSSLGNPRTGKGEGEDTSQR